jgi:hypothetical protein
MQQALLAKQTSEQQPYVDKLKATIDSPKPEAPALQAQPTAPKQGDFGEDSQSWVTSISVLSALTGAFSRQHATTALNAFGAGMKGYQEGNKLAFDEAHKQWKDASEAAITNNKALTDKYKAILDDRSMTEEEQLSGIKAIAAQYHDNLQAASTSISQSVAIYDSQVKAAATAVARSARLQEKHDAIQEQLMKPEEVDYYAKLANTGDVSAVASATRGPAGMMNYNAIKKRQAELNIQGGRTPEQQAATDQDYKANQKGLSSLSVQAAKMATAGRESDSLGDLLVTASDKVDRTKFPKFNDIILASEKGTGDQDVVAYGASLNSFINAYARAINPTGASTVSDKEHARDLLETGYSKGQITAAVEQLKKETQKAREAPVTVKDEMEGKKPTGGATHRYNPDTGSIEEIK